MTDSDLLHFNGISGATGAPLFPPIPPALLGKAVGAGAVDEAERDELTAWWSRVSEAGLGPEQGVDPLDLAQAGWGVVFAARDAARVPDLCKALDGLLALRRAQAGDRFRVFDGDAALRPGESKLRFLARHGVGPGPAQPEFVPYYLLLVGDPEAIPFAFQCQLDVQYAVGRLHFETLEDYTSYARTVVAAESGRIAAVRPGERPRLALFGPENEGDPATSLSRALLVDPLGDDLAGAGGWQVERWVGARATKDRLRRLLGGSETPQILFTAGHGVGFPPDDGRQPALQGALLCSDWPEETAEEGGEPFAPPPSCYLAADDVVDDAQFQGLLAFFFACYGAGTPARLALPGPRPPRIEAPRAFVARLPARLLALPRGGALAVIGHVGPAWSYSFRWEEAGPQRAVFLSTLKCLMAGQPVGWALEALNSRFAELATEIYALRDEIALGARPDAFALARLWTAAEDARNYIVLGDPAARLPVAAARSSHDPPDVSS